jgi:predicted nucleotide-binding protein
MIKRNNAQPKIQMITELIISKSELDEKISERIIIGANLFNQQINTTTEFSKLRRDFSDWNDYNSEYLKQIFNNPNNEYKRGYDDSGKFIGLYQQNITPEKELQNFKELIFGKIDKLKKLKAKSELLKTNIKDEKLKLSEKPKGNKTEVFIVHGHDEEAQSKTARFIEKLGFKPIILSEQASSSKTIIEKIETYSNVGFGIILYTPCDLGAKKEDNPNYKNRARQNVVFEHGFLIGKIGRENVCVLVKDDIETPNDISGIVYTKMDNENAWQFKLAKELKNSGYEVDMNKL